MEVLHPCCCGIDGHQASLAVCVAIKECESSAAAGLNSTTTMQSDKSHEPRILANRFERAA